MLKIKFFHTPKAKKFNYKPLYYNPDEEERRERREKVLGRTAPGMSIKGSFRDRQKQKRKTNRTSNLRAFIIIVLLLLLGYYLIFDKIPFFNF